MAAGQPNTLQRAVGNHPGLYRALVVLGCAAISIAVHYPGRLGPDATWQFQQAVTRQFSDWHPPVMVALWRLLLPLSAGPAPMFLFQAGLYWLGVWAIWDGSRGEKGWRGWLILAPALHPLLLVLLQPVLKDVGLAGALIAAFGLLFRQRQLGRPMTPGIAAAVVLLLAYGTLVRANGIFAIPLLLLYWARPYWLRAGRVIPATILFAAMAVPASQFVNHRVLGAEPSGVEGTLQLYDLAGIAHFSAGQDGVKAPLGCYNPLHWDTLNQPRCGRLFDRLTRPGAAPLGQAWLQAIVAHPLAYARHRLEHFNSSIYFLVAPAHHCRFAPDYGGCDRPRATLLVADFIRKNLLYWPCLWLIAGCWLLTRRDADAAVRALAWSGTIYGAAYLVVGVATDHRYYFWTILAVGFGTALHLARTDRLKGEVQSLAIPVLLVAVAGYTARLLHAAAGFQPS